LTTPEEEAFLIQPEKQDLMAQAIANAFTSYKNDLKNDKTQDNDSKPTPSIDTTSKQENPRVEKPRVEKPRVEKPVVKADSIVYRIQFCTSSTNLDISDKQFAGLKKVQKYKENNIWKYTTESSSSYNEILGLLPAVKKSYPDAFMVAFKNNEKISISEARRLQK
jgi:N-acetylmuramoyl-L-alanine amidase